MCDACTDSVYERLRAAEKENTALRAEVEGLREQLKEYVDFTFKDGQRCAQLETVALAAERRMDVWTEETYRELAEALRALHAAKGTESEK